MHQTIPQAHPHASEPLIDDQGFSIELWSDWVILEKDLDSYRRAAHTSTVPTGDDPRYAVQGLAALNEGTLWVSMSLAGTGIPGDAQWSLLEDLFHQFWESVHRLAMI